MNCTDNAVLTQSYNEVNVNFDGNLIIPSSLQGFKQDLTKDVVVIPKVADNAIVSSITRVYGNIIDTDTDVCPHCGAKLYSNGSYDTVLKHLPLGQTSLSVVVTRKRKRCTCCGKSFVKEIPFKAEKHNITETLKKYIEKLLTMAMTLKAISDITGVDEHIIKAIDNNRLEDEQTEIDENGNRRLKKPTEYAKYIAVDEFKLNNEYRYATVIIDLETGYILYFGRSKKKVVIEEFMKLVGDDWMNHVEALACDMNADFSEAFQAKYPHIDVVYDRFHIRKNFNDMVIGPVRKDVQRQLIREKKYEEAYTAYLESLDKYVLDTIYKKVKNDTATKLESMALSQYYGIVQLKQSEYNEYKYRKQKYLLELDKETVMNSGKQKLIEKYQAFYISKQDTLYKGILKNYSINHLLNCLREWLYINVLHLKKKKLMD